MRKILLFDFIKGEILETTSQENLEEILNTLREEYKEKTDLIIGKDYFFGVDTWFIKTTSQNITRITLEEEVKRYLKK